jgi:hypothetical protein
MIRAFLEWLSDRLPAKLHDDRGRPYVYWYHVLTIPGLLRVQLHRFVSSDSDGLHDHPWGWARAFILAGWYIEERRDGTRIRGAGSTYGLTGDVFHRVHLPDQAEVWSLFVHGPYVKHWGFLRPLDPLAISGWRMREACRWIYEARARHAEAFDDWWKTAPKGRALRKRKEFRNRFLGAS